MAITDSLVTYYKLDETSGTNADDAHGAYDGTLVGATPNATGILNKCVSFDGTNDRIETPLTSQGEMSGTAFTVSCWINPTSVSGLQVVVNDNSGAGGSIFIGLSGSAVQFTIATPGGNVITQGGTISTGAGWYHLVGTYDGSNVILYINNSQIDTDTQTGTMLAKADYYIGMRQSASDREFNGLIDEIGFWNRALSEAEIESLWNNSNGLAYPFAVVGTTRLIKIGGTFVAKPIKTKVAGTFIDKPIKIKVGNTFQDT